jgi:hypothetical protein
MKTTETTSKKSNRNAHLLLGAYWGYKVLTGGSIPKTTVEVIRMERNSILRQKKKAQAAVQNDRKSTDQKKKSKPASAALTGIAKNALLRKAGKKILRNARVF